MKIAFAYSTKDRPEFTLRTIKSLDCGGFDLFWIDGSQTMEGKNCALYYAGKFKNTLFKAIHFDITGGPDSAIIHSLQLMLAFKYDCVGLIENDVLLKEGWLESCLKTLTGPAEEKIGAVTCRTIKDRVIDTHPGYATMWNMGAGMVLFTAQAARIILSEYATITASEVYNFWQTQGHTINNNELFNGQTDRGLGADWRYAMTLKKHGLSCAGTIPSLAENIDVVGGHEYL